MFRLVGGKVVEAPQATEFHGFGLAQHMRERANARQLTAHGTLYKALGRLEDRGLLVSRWEDPDVAIDEGRPRRRLYELTGAGQRAAARAAQRSDEQGTFGLRPDHP